MAALTADPQLRLVEDHLDDAALSAQLETWQEAKDALAAPRKRFAQVNDQVKAAIDALELAEGDYRCGRFRLRVSTSEPKRVEFERTSKRRVTIKRECTDYADAIERGDWKFARSRA